MPFDVAGARAAGYTDADIASFLGSQSGFDVDGAVKAGYQPSEIVGFLSEKKDVPPQDEVDPLLRITPSTSSQNLPISPITEPGQKSVLENLPAEPEKFNFRRASAADVALNDQRNTAPRMTEGAAPKADPNVARGAQLADSSLPVRAGAKAATSLAQGLGGITRAVGDLSGSDALSRFGAAAAKGARAFDVGMGESGPVEGFGPKSPVPYLKDMAEGATSSMAQSALFAAAFGPAGVIPAMSLQTAGQEYDQARAQGLDPAMALAGAVPKGIFEAVGEKFTGLDKAAAAMGTLLKAGASDQAKRSAGEVLLHAGIREIPGEVVTYLGQTGTDLIPGIGLRQDLTMKDFIDGLRDTVVQAAMMGGAMGGGGALATRGETAPKPIPSAQSMGEARFGRTDPIPEILSAPTVDHAIEAAAKGLNEIHAEKTQQSELAVSNIAAILEPANVSVPVGDVAPVQPGVSGGSVDASGGESAGGLGDSAGRPASDAGISGGAPVAVDATGGEPSPVTFAQRPQPFSYTANPSGTVTVKGNPAKIRAHFAEFGITSIAPVKGGVLVGKSQAKQAVEALSAPQATTVSPALVDAPVAATVQPTTLSEAAPTAVVRPIERIASAQEQANVAQEAKRAEPQESAVTVETPKQVATSEGSTVESSNADQAADTSPSNQANPENRLPVSGVRVADLRANGAAPVAEGSVSIAPNATPDGQNGPTTGRAEVATAPADAGVSVSAPAKPETISALPTERERIQAMPKRAAEKRAAEQSAKQERVVAEVAKAKGEPAKSEAATRSELANLAKTQQAAGEAFKDATPAVHRSEAKRIDKAAAEMGNKGLPEVKSQYEALAESHRAAADAKEAKAAPAKIEDFGEKLEGARKDKTYSLDKDVSDEALATEPLGKVWPADEWESFEDNFVAAVAFTARSEVPAKPRVSYKLKRWVENVKTVRGLAKMVADGEVTKAQILDLATKFRLDGFFAKVKLLESLPRDQWKRIGMVREYPNAYRYDDGKQVASPLVNVEIDGTNRRYPVGSVDQALERILASLDTEVPETKKMQFEVRGREGAWFINKKGDKEYRKLKTFTDSKEALAYVRSNYADLVAAWDSVKERDNVKETDVRSTENRPRTGKEYRNGKDVSAEQFQKAFGFRGGQFGNWVNQGAGAAERQWMLNRAYDALMDLADIVGTPPKAISLNGTLGVSFGARGHGWASAHFEPDTLVINLTKTRGAGALAHEWFHALDNYFARQRGGEVKVTRGLNAQAAYREQNFITYRPEPMMVHKSGQSTLTKAALEAYRERNPNSGFYKAENWSTDTAHPQGVRIEVEAAWADVVKALNASPMAQRSRSIDKGPEGYWSQIIERGARSFENYVISKMMEKGYHNDYLANVVPVEDFPRSKDRYPYLLPEEVQPIAEAFDGLFGTLQTKETETGTVLFKRSQSAAPAGITRTEFSDAMAKAFGPAVAARLEKRGVVIPLEDQSSLPDHVVPFVRDNDIIYGFYDDRTDKTYAVLSNLTPEMVKPLVLHEVGVHYGFEAMLGKDKYNQVINRLAVMGKAGHKAVVEAKRQAKEGSAKPSHVPEETLAYLVTYHPEMSLVREVIAKIKAFLFDKLGIGGKYLTADDMVALAKAAVLHSSRTEPGMRTPDFAPSFARSTVTETAEAAPESPRQSPWRDELGRLQFAPGAWLYNKLGTAATPLLNKLSLKTVSPELRRALREMKLQVAKAQETAAAVAGEANKLSAEEREVVSDLIEKELKAGTIPPEHAVKLAAMINNTMGAQTDELVRLGMLTKDAAEKWRGQYLPRFYESKLTRKAGDLWSEAMRGLRGRTSVMKGIKGKHLKGRGLYENVTPDQIESYKALGWEVRDPDYEAYLKEPGLYEGKWESEVQMWRDFTRQERDDMGEIRDAGFRFVMGYMQTQKDIALGRMFEQLATNPDMSSRIASEKFTVQVPKTEVSGTGAKVYGKLAGRFVSQETLAQLSVAEEMQSEILQTYRKAMSVWKESKTVLNPVSHVNNMVSNLTMAHFAGVGYHRVDKYMAAAVDFAKKSDGIKEAKEAGLFLGTMSDAELMNVLPDELKLLALKQEGAAQKIGRTAFNILSFYLRKPMGWAYQNEDTFFRYLIYKEARSRGLEPNDAVDYAQKYIFTYDDLPKGARRVRDFAVPFFAYTYKAIPALLETAMVHPDRFAAPAAVLWLANAAAYAIGSDDDDSWDEKLKKYISDPEYRAAVRKNEKLEREHLPSWMKGTTALGSPKAIRLGMDELTKLPLFIDVSRIIPGGDLFDVNPNAGGIDWIPQPFTPSHPLFTTAVGLLANKDLWFGKELTDNNDTSGEKFDKRAAWLWKQFSPAIAVGNYHWERGMNALAQATGKEMTYVPDVIGGDATGIGRDGLPVQPKLAAIQTFGIKIRPYDLDKAEQIDGAVQRKMIREIDAEMRSLRRLNNLGAVNDRTYEKARELADTKKDRIRNGLTIDGAEKD